MQRKKSMVISTKNEVYQKNFLKGVLFRLDFPKINLNFLEDFYAEIKILFPFQSRREGINLLFPKVKENKIDRDDIQTSIWVFENFDKTKKIHISTNSILIEYNKYTNKLELLKDTEDLLGKFLKYSKIETINRVGLRYINEINLNEIKDDFSWDKYISLELLGSLNFAKKDKEAKLAQAINKVVLKEGVADVSFTYGIFNSDFPNESIRREFALDYDCYSRFPINPQDTNIVEIVKTYNSYIEKLFELSITDSLRKIMSKK
jgi:uncharacterized protein (TIGR04255 family)